MAALSVAFWLLLSIVFYTYIGYALLLIWLKQSKSKHQNTSNTILPSLTIVIASYNEEAVLTDKIKNTLALDYPAHKLEVIIITDGSTDTSTTILQRYPSVQALHLDERRGKAAAINRAMQVVDTPIVVFSDANTILNRDCLLLLVKHFNAERTGAVAGEKKVASYSGMGSAEGWYWQYESFLKRLDASFYSVVGAAGELFAMRTSLFASLPEDTILDDFALSMQVCLKGYRIAYEPSAFATEAPSASLEAEKQRKIRIATGAFQALRRLPGKQLMAIKRLGFQFFSRRWLRWVVCPPALIALFILNAVLALSTGTLYEVIFIFHALFYGLAIIGWMHIRQNKVSVLTTVPFYFLFMNYCMLVGLLHFWQRKGTVLWTKAERLPAL
ncbi:MAG: Poly-beta,6-N-acetyl-D-glucosamine synthase [Flaviaesturariibacter sp.]|nr:Poly-beta,6-N-acetyl-D-glucosamine synthase [Flaviaesturariibacter sp.]